MIGLSIFTVNYGIAMAPQAMGERISMQITNKSGKNLNILQHTAKGHVRVGSVRGNASTMISNIEMTKDQYMPNEEGAYLDIVDSQENKKEYTFQILRNKSAGHRVVRAQFLPSTVALGQNIRLPEPGFFEYDAARGATTVLISLTIGNNTPQNPTIIDVTALQGPAQQ